MGERERERERVGRAKREGETGRLPREITIRFRSRGVWKFSSPPGGTRRWLLVGGGLDLPSVVVEGTRARVKESGG